MTKNKIINGVRNFFKAIYIQLFKIGDTPQKIALGFGLGVFLGIFPGTGPAVALLCAIILRVNRAAALVGALFTNTWTSIVTFLLAVKIGAVVMRLNWQDVRQEWVLFLRDFHWINIFKLSLLKTILPIILGYTIIGFALGLISYIVILIILKKRARPL